MKIARAYFFYYMYKFKYFANNLWKIYGTLRREGCGEGDRAERSQSSTYNDQARGLLWLRRTPSGSYI